MSTSCQEDRDKNNENESCFQHMLTKLGNECNFSQNVLIPFSGKMESTLFQ